MFNKSTNDAYRHLVKINKTRKDDHVTEFKILFTCTVSNRLQVDVRTPVSITTVDPSYYEFCYKFLNDNSIYITNVSTLRHNKEFLAVYKRLINGN